MLHRIFIDKYDKLKTHPIRKWTLENLEVKNWSPYCDCNGALTANDGYQLKSHWMDHQLTLPTFKIENISDLMQRTNFSNKISGMQPDMFVLTKLG